MDLDNEPVRVVLECDLVIADEIELLASFAAVPELAQPTETGLDLSENQISELSPLSNLTNLSYLPIRYNGITDISPLAASLDLIGNQISDISPLLENSGLGGGDQISLRGNNLDLSQGSDDRTYIDRLRERG